MRTDRLGPVTVPVAGDIAGVHDPVIAREGKRYYVYFSHGGIQTLSSTDLVHWTKGPQALNGDPAWARKLIPKAAPNDLWAPDLSYWGGLWHLYYTKSQWVGAPTRNSAIGFATSPTLDPHGHGYGWTDHGPVVTSEGTIANATRTDGWNAIDPAVTLDEKGQPWLSWGSAFDGIFLQRLGPNGKLAPGTKPVNLARRSTFVSVVEASQLIRHDGYWWLFTSYDYCCAGTKSSYNIDVGRSKAITGPYLDREGRPLISPRDGSPDGGTKVLAGYGGVYGPGHQAVLHDGSHWWLIHHWYNPAYPYSPGQPGRPELGIRPLDWDAEGWPVARGWTPALKVPKPY